MKKILLLTLAISLVPVLGSVHAANKSQIDRGVQESLETLYANSPQAREVAKVAKGILVFPRVKKAGFIIGGQTGDGALIINGKTMGYYRTTAISYGLQVGVQTFGYALFFLTEDDLNFLENSKGWEIGTGPTLVVADRGASGALTSTTLKKGVHAYFFNQKGLMAGLGLQGTKISKIKR